MMRQEECTMDKSCSDSEVDDYYEIGRQIRQLRLKGHVANKQQRKSSQRRKGTLQGRGGQYL